MDKSTFLHSHTLEATHMRIRPHTSSPLSSPPLLLRCRLGAASYLRDSPRVVCGLSSPGSTPRAATVPLSRPGVLLRSEPRLLTARTLRGSALPASRSPLSSPPLLLRCRLGAASYPPGLAARGVWALSPGSPPRSATAPLRVPASSLRSEPRLLTARTLRGSVLSRLRRAHCRLYYGSR